ncbi:prepilin-type N-terminal cleavage/methylation domain-containing protein [Opitutaceae bacterium TAV1]|nr:prepilin-type N-terminal cleavage/methylation domain-containing protein [Opitutaceae bacterium TAV1]
MITPKSLCKRSGFTLVELLTVIAIIGILAAIIIPTVGRVRQSARAATCLSNIRQSGMAVLLYAESNRGKLPGLANPYWDLAALRQVTEIKDVSKFDSTNSIIKCPEDNVVRATGFEHQPRSWSLNPVVINYNNQYLTLGARSPENEGILLTNIGAPSKTAMLVELHDRLNLFNNGNNIVALGSFDSHGGAMNVAMCDGSARRIVKMDTAGFKENVLKNH